MSEQNHLELGRVILDFPIQAYTLKSLHVHEEANAHGSLTLLFIAKGPVSEQDCIRYADSPIRILDDQGNPIFCGTCSLISTHNLNQYCEVQIEAHTHSQKMDVAAHSRTFQDPGKMLSQVLEQMLEPYGALFQIQEDKVIPEMLSQQAETDWDFIKRICNQFGYPIFVNSKVPYIQLSIGAVPFSSTELPSCTDTSWIEKDISQYWKVKNQIAPEASAYEFLQKGFTLDNLTAGAGHMFLANGREMFVTRNDIYASGGLLYNRILLTYKDGVYAQLSKTSNFTEPQSHIQTEAVPPAFKQSTNQPTGPSALFGKVLAVSGTDVQVLFDVDVGGSGAGVRWIPYCNFFNNDFYCMPDVGDTVFCYYENEGSAICLGSRHVNNTRDDFSYPWEKMMTANNRMIRFKSHSVEFNANRKEYDGEDDQPVKIVLSEDTGIEISSEKDINITSDHNILIQSNDLDTVKENPIEWFESSRKKNMQQFDQDQQKGENKYISDGGNTSYNADWKMLEILGASFYNAFNENILQPLLSVSDIPLKVADFVSSIFTSSDSASQQEDKPKSEELDLYQIDLFASMRCVLAIENRSSIQFSSNGEIEIASPKFRWLGFDRKSDYEAISEFQKTSMDNLLDVIQLGLDIAGCIPVCSAINAGISLLRGDYAEAFISLIGVAFPGFSLFNIVLNSKKYTVPFKASILGLKALIAAAQTNYITGQIFNDVKYIIYLLKSEQFSLSDPESMSSVISLVQHFRAADDSISKATDAYGKLTSNKPNATASQHTENNLKPDKVNKQSQNTEASDVQKQNQNTFGDPIDAITGSQKIVQTEFIIHDLTGDFPVQRSYESIYTNAGGLLGSRWFLNIGSWIYIDRQNASIMMPDMHLEKFTFRPEQQQWVNCRGADLSLSLEQLRDGYSLTAVKEKKVYRYDAKGRLVSIADLNGNRIWLRYVGDTLTQMEFPSGQSLSFTYSANKIASIRDTLGRTVRYTYDQELLTCVEYNNGGQIHYVYTPEGYLAQITDQNGHTYLKDEYDSLGRVTRQMLSNGQEYVLFYDDANRCNTFLDTITGYRTFYYYNSANLTTKTCFEDGSEERYAYDEKQNKVLISDRRGHEMHQRFNEQSLLVYQELPNGLVTQFTYDAQGNMSRQWDNAGRDKTYQYDQNGNLVQFTNTIDESSCQTTKITYDSKGRITAVCTPGGGEWVYSYDGNLPYPDLITSPNGACIRYHYDQAGRCMSIITDQGQTDYAYNDWDRCCQITDPLEHTTKYLFDLLCNLIKVIRPNQYNPSLGDGPGTRYVYDEMDEQVLRIDALGNVWATLRDAAENVVKEIHPNTYDFQTNDGEGIRSEYDSNDNKIRIIYPDQSIERIFYDPMGNILKKVQPMDYDAKRDDGVGYTYEYDEVNRLVQITAPDGTVEKRYVYDLCGNIVKLIDATGYLTGKTDAERIGSLYTYNYAGWLTEERKPCQYGADGQPQYQLTQYKYDVAGNCIEERRYLHFQTETSMSGPLHVIRFEYDKADRLVKVSDQTGAAVEYTYDLQNRRIKERRRLRPGVNQLFRWKYDAGGRLIEQGHMVERADGGTAWASVLYDYDKTGNIVHIQMPAGGEVFREYDVIDRLTAETHVDKAAGIHNRTEFAYDKAGNLVEITDNQGHKTKIEYDLLNHEIRRTAPDGGVTRSFYNGNGLLAKQVRPNQYDPKADNGEGYQYTYDHQGNIVSVVGPDGHVLQTNVYDGDGRLLQQLDAVQSGASFTYDLAGNRVHIETTSGATQQLEYDAHGNIVGVVDGNHNRTRYRLDEWGRIIGILKPDESTESYTYDFAGNMTSSTDGEGHTTRYEYNVAEQMKAIVDPTGEQETYLYDGEDRLISRTDRNGVTVEMGYNLYGAPLFRKVKNGTLGDFYEYTPEGLLKCAISDGMRYAYEYDSMDRLVRKSASGRTLLSLAYDKNGNKTRQADVTGKVTEFDYSPLDLLVKVWEDGNELAAYEYNADGTIRQEQHGPVLKQYHYDQDKNLTGLFVQSGNAILANNRYLYDGNGNRTHKKQLGGETLYHYDPLNQLQKVQYPGYTEELFYDKAGNRTRRIAQGVEEFYQYDPRNRLTAYTKNGATTLFRYDHAGNLLADDKARYSYDAFNRTTRVETFDGNIQVNRYDAEGLRHEMEENGSLVKFIFNPDREAVVEENSSGLTRYIRSSELIARNTDAARTYYHYVSDEMGSTTHIVDEDGIVLNHYNYDAWGNLTAQEEAVPNRFKFTGQQLDPVTQQYYLRARFYNPVIARFTQEDTYRGDGLNLYAYCANNPILYADLTGHEKDLLSRHSNDSTFEERFNQNLQEELVFNKQHGLQTYYDTPQAKAQNEHITNNQPSKTTSDIPTERKNSTDYTYNMIENPGPLADMPDYPIKNFYGGKYNETILSEDTVFYRAGQEGTPLGQWFTTTPAESVAKVRIDLAVKPQWIDPITGNLTGTSIINTNYSIKIPAGTTIYYGPVGYQGGVYLGGDNIIQTFIPKPWLIDGVEVIGQTPLQ